MTKNNNQMFIWGAVALVVVAIVVTVVVLVMKNRNKGDDYSPMGPMSPFASEYPSSNMGGNGSPTPIGGSSTYYTSPTPGSSPMGNDDDVM